MINTTESSDIVKNMKNGYVYITNNKQDDYIRKHYPYFLYKLTMFKTIRLGVLDDIIFIYYRCDEAVWHPTQYELDDIRKEMRTRIDGGYTLWNNVCYETNFRIFCKSDDEYEFDIVKYMHGDYDDKYKNVEGYVPSTTPIPKWTSRRGMLLVNRKEDDVI